MNHITRPKKQPLMDWHRADIVCSLRKAGWSLRGLSKHHGYCHSTALIQALNKPWPKGERLVADAIGISPETIWPERFEMRRLRTLKRDAKAAKKRKQ